MLRRQRTSSILVTLSEGADLSTALDPTAWQIVPNQAQIADVQSTNASATSFLLILNNTLIPSTLYTLTAPGIRDCSGNAIVSNSSIQIGLSESPTAQDLVINEILFNPNSGGFRYVELYNRSNKIVDLSKCSFFGGSLSSPTTVTLNTQNVLLPDSFVVFSANSAYTISTYAPRNPAVVLNNTIPTLPDDEGIIALRFTDGGQTFTVDSVHYFKEWHSPIFECC